MAKTNLQSEIVTDLALTRQGLCKAPNCRVSYAPKPARPAQTGHLRAPKIHFLRSKINQKNALETQIFTAF